MGCPLMLIYLITGEPMSQLAESEQFAVTKYQNSVKDSGMVSLKLSRM